MKRLLMMIAVCLVASAISAQPYDFQNTKLDDNKRVQLFIKHLTLEEKMMWMSPMLGTQRLGVPIYGCYEGLHGLALGGPSRNNGVKTVDGKEVPDDLPTTIFPQAYGMGCTWDRSLIQRIGEIEAEEVRWYAQGNIARRKGLVVFAPNADLARDPRWGRTEESYGEDPYLVGQLTISMVKGLQGNDPRYWKTCALMKHFLANSNEDGRDSTSSDFDERLFREYYSYPFYKGITEGGSRAFMASYNKWNGIPMAVHPCLNEVARKEWGNNGIICTDGGAFSLLLTAHHYYPDLTAAAAGVVKAGTSQFLDRFLPNLKEAVEKGLITEADIENAISGNIYVALKLGLLDDKCPYDNIGKDTTAMPPYEREEVKQFVREVTAKSIVLLKNEKQTLPINPQKVKKIAVVGPYADKIIYDWYSGTAPYENTILKAMQDVGKQNGIEILYAPDNQFGRAEDLAKEADMVLVCTGNHPYGTDRTWKVCPVPSDGREANDRHSLQLPDEDEIRRLYTINPNIVLVLVSSFPYAINWSNDHLPAIIHVTHCSQEQGYGVTDVLFGKVNPAGRTNQTWVRDILDLPHILDYDIRHGRTYMYFKGEALYPFGYGLSYTSFNYEQARVQKQDKQNVYVSVSITNTGKRDGDEVVQLYASYPESKVEHPKRQLKAFERVSIPAGQTKEVILKVSKSDLSYWDETRHSFVPETGRIQLEIGASSADIRKVIFLD
ncbi:MAG: glycoside hydrolase family 3 C-terminal domain-containing protein [Bacteroidales bacterium]|nr:glycoside hydrolase family 3 C-terminal domain-containing protein [Bacteroidales bacterium]